MAELHELTMIGEDVLEEMDRCFPANLPRAGAPDCVVREWIGARKAIERLYQIRTAQVRRFGGNPGVRVGPDHPPTYRRPSPEHHDIRSSLQRRDD